MGKNDALGQTTDRLYNVSILTYSRSQYIDLIDKCNAIMFTNIGDTIARVNGMVIFPSATPLTALGDSRSIGGNENEIFKGTIQLAFDVPAGANPLVEVVQRFYL